MENKKMSTYRLQPEVLDKLDDIAARSGMSKAQVIELAILRLYNHCPHDQGLQKEYFRNMSTL